MFVSRAYLLFESVLFVLQKADRKALDSKVNTKLFDKTTEEINNMIKEILDKLAGHVSFICTRIHFPSKSFSL